MSGVFILNKIREHFPDMAENIDITHLNNSGNIQYYLNILASQIPNMPFDHMHRMCQRQEKTVLSKIQQIKEVDIYDEIAQINPSLNLRELSMEQVSKKISYLKPEPLTSEREEIEEEDLQFQIRSHRSDYDNRQNELKNILEDQDHAHPWWNDNKIFEFN